VAEIKPNTLFTNPAVTPFVECPSCKRLIDWKSEACPHCREEIDPDYARLSTAIVVHNTAACSSANTIKTGEYAALIVVLATFLGIWVVDHGLVIVNLLTPVLSIAAIVVWFRRFGLFQFGDAEYEKAQKDMRNSLKFWIAFLVVQSLVLVYLFKLWSVGSAS